MNTLVNILFDRFSHSLKYKMKLWTVMSFIFDSARFKKMKKKKRIDRKKWIDKKNKFNRKRLTLHGCSQQQHDAKRIFSCCFGEINQWKY